MTGFTLHPLRPTRPTDATAMQHSSPLSDTHIHNSGFFCNKHVLPYLKIQRQKQSKKSHLDLFKTFHRTSEEEKRGGTSCFSIPDKLPSAASLSSDLSDAVSWNSDS